MECCCQEKGFQEVRFKNDTVDLGLLEPVIEKYRQVPGSLISVLQEAQAIYAYLPLPVLDYIAERMEIKPAKIYGVATFYTQFRLKPIGKHLILLCKGTACHVNGADRIERALCEELKINIGDTTKDGMFTLDTAACLGCCSLAPVMMIDGQAYGPLTPDKASKIIQDIYAQNSEEGEAE